MITGSHLIRWTGVAAIIAGIIFAGIQPIHPPDEVASVTTSFWTLIISLKLIMCFLFLVGFAGLYVRQSEEAGWLGLLGYLIVSTSWALQSGFVFAELFVLPPLTAEAPEFVDSMLGLGRGTPGSSDVGALAPTYLVVGLAYLLGGVLFGIATVRANVLPRWPAILLAVTALLTPLAALLPHAIQRLAAIPMGIAIAWLGYSLWSERRSHRSQGR